MYSVVHGMPSDLRAENELQIDRKIVEEYKTGVQTGAFDKRKMY